MKTIIIVYTNTKLTEKEIGNIKKYCFNTEADLKEGDILKSPDYSTGIQVVKVLDKPYVYYNQTTGDLSNDFISTQQWKLKTLVLGDKDGMTVHATLVK